ncbi:flavin-containing monooxygenase FMO [Wilcoxina mikolae CBS 423.85]|nr:flavin-containing monooxygenase FMO [Wilcoxina mikolae CBS 423.85]
MVIFEKSAGFGGVWYANTYPGAACDIVSHIYSISWFPKYDWSRRYSPQDEIRGYYDHVARYYRLEKSTQFKTTVTAAHWNDETLLWHVHVRDSEGTQRYYTANVVISAIGQLNRPKRAAIPGAASFKGPQFHTAEWDHSVDLTGKRVAVIGTGPSAGQVIPSIAPKVKELHVYQRSPPHILPRQDYAFSPLVKGIFKFVPFAQWFHHLWLYYDQEMTPYRSVHVASAEHIGATQYAQFHMESQIPAELKDLREKFTPHYAFGCKRPLFLDNYYPTFLRDNVTLNTIPPTEISEDAVITADGERKVDVIIWATGFLTQDLLGHVDVRGHNGVRLKEQWGETAQAYLGTSVHNFPNLFFVYGPATGLLWGSLTFMFETQALWNVKMLKEVYGSSSAGWWPWGKKKRVAYAVKQEVEKSYNEEMQEKLKVLALTDKRCTSFYKNSRGVVTTNFPWRLAEYWRRLLWVEWGLYDVWQKEV